MMEVRKRMPNNRIFFLSHLISFLSLCPLSPLDKRGDKGPPSLSVPCLLPAPCPLQVQPHPHPPLVSVSHSARLLSTTSRLLASRARTLPRPPMYAHAGSGAAPGVLGGDGRVGTPRSSMRQSECESVLHCKTVPPRERVPVKKCRLVSDRHPKCTPKRRQPSGGSPPHFLKGGGLCLRL